jgi:hypothetical protein
VSIVANAITYNIRIPISGLWRLFFRKLEYGKRERRKKRVTSKEMKEVLIHYLN